MSRPKLNGRFSQRRPPGTRQSAAFTLLELLIVVALVALVSTISWPSVRRSLSRGEFQRTVDEVSALLAEGRSRAAARARPHIVQIDPRQRRLLLLEVRFDEADLSHFEASGGAFTGPRRADRSAQNPLVDEAEGRDTSRDEAVLDDPTLSDIAQRDPLPTGVRLRLLEKLELPQGVTVRLVDPGEKPSLLLTDPNLTADSRDTREADDNIEPHAFASFPLAVKPTRFVFDASGRTADEHLEIAAKDGAYARLSIDASSEKSRPDVRRRRTAEPADPRQNEDAR